MRIIGIGTDIIEVLRIAQMIERHGDLFLRRVFTTWEIEYCSTRKSSNQHYAGRWAAKEAILKALGTGWANGIKWADLEIRNEPGGQPKVALGGRAREVAEEMGIQSLQISISHCRHFATAFAIALAGGKS